jgi:succinate dehydrogenase hydrophobic anchor subunit
MRRVLRDNGLSLVLFSLFLLFLVGESLAGLKVQNEERRQHGQPAISYGEFLTSGEFIESTTENWESEFLEMAAYVLFTAFLFQRGSAESRKMDEPEAVDRDPALAKASAHAPWPVRRGGWILRVYQHSLSLAFLLLFLTSFLLHAWGGMRAYNDQQRAHGESSASLVQFMGTPEFWFQSLQNWQSEFLGIGSMVVLSIFLRQRGSPESKPVDAPHSQTGGG